jgi:hypothetical protein
LRSYLPADNPQKHLEIGSEPTPAAFLSTLLALTREWRRLLAPHGSLCVELGDTYSGSGGAGGDYGEQGLRNGQPKFDGSGRRNRPADVAAGILPPQSRPGPEGRDTIPGWPLDKSLCGIPDAYQLSLAYGWNMLDPTDNGHPQWRVRNKIVWHRPNPPVGALGDKVRPSTSYVTVACTSRTRWFDLVAERTEHTTPDTRAETPHPRQMRGRIGTDGENGPSASGGNNPAGAPPLDCWTIPPAPYRNQHYATFPPALPRKLINLMCPMQVCRICGEPRRRIVQADRVGEKDDRQRKTKAGEYRLNGHDHPPEIGWEFNRTTLGWTDCGHDNYRRGVVLDPFAGSGTTLMAASELGRDSIGIDLDSRNLELARERCGMFLVEDDEVAV